MIIRDILRRIMRDDIEVEYRVKVRIGGIEHEVVELITEGETVFICGMQDKKEDK